MGHFCRICGRIRPNEKISGKGHKTHVCKECHRLPKDEREKIDLDAELAGFLRQSRISKKNIKRLTELSGHSDPEVARRAELLIRVAKIAEGKRKRWRKVNQADRALLFACGEAGLIENWIPEDEYRASGALWEHDDGPEEWASEYEAGLLEPDDSPFLREGVYRSCPGGVEDRSSRKEDSWDEEDVPF